MLKQRLTVSQTEFAGDRSHYLYKETPVIVKNKVEALIASGVKPSIDSKDEKYWKDLIYKADIMLYPSKKTIDEAMRIYDLLTTVIATLAFVPCGVKIFGYRYEVIDEDAPCRVSRQA